MNIQYTWQSNQSHKHSSLLTNLIRNAVINFVTDWKFLKMFITLNNALIDISCNLCSLIKSGNVLFNSFWKPHWLKIWNMYRVLHLNTSVWHFHNIDESLNNHVSYYATCHQTQIIMQCICPVNQCIYVTSFTDWKWYTTTELWSLWYEYLSWKHDNTII